MASTVKARSLTPLGPIWLMPSVSVEASPSGTTPALLVSETTSSGDQVNDQNDHRYDQKQMNQGAADMEAEAQEP
jgi:hypothetical protein